MESCSMCSLIGLLALSVCLRVQPCSLLHSAPPQYAYAIIYLSISLLKDFLVVSSLGLSQTMLLCTFSYGFWCTYDSISLGVYLGVDVLGLRKC